MADVVRTPRNYRIEIRGELGDQFCVLFAPMTLHRDVGTTVLTGPVRDQSQLLGLIGTIQELGCFLPRRPGPIFGRRPHDLEHEGPDDLAR